MFHCVRCKPDHQFTIITTDICLDATGVPGKSAFLTARNTTGTGIDAVDELHDRRTNALRVYTVILLCQIVGIFIS